MVRSVGLLLNFVDPDQEVTGKGISEYVPGVSDVPSIICLGVGLAYSGHLGQLKIV